MNLNINTAPNSHDLPLQVSDLTVAYSRKPVLWDVDLDIPEGKLVGIVGPNGAGKSTLIKAVLEENPNHGAALHLLGKIDMLKSDWEGAIYLLKKARRARPQDDDIRRDLRRAEHEALKPKKGEGLGSVLGGLFSKKKK